MHTCDSRDLRARPLKSDAVRTLATQSLGIDHQDRGRAVLGPRHAQDQEVGAAAIVAQCRGVTRDGEETAVRLGDAPAAITGKHMRGDFRIRDERSAATIAILFEPPAEVEKI